MEKFRTALNKALELLAGLSMAVMVILTTYQVIAVISSTLPPPGRRSWSAICSAGAPCLVPPSFPVSAAT